MTKWRFPFGDVELTERRLAISATDSFKNVEKSYKDAMDALDKKASSVLKDTLDKGKAKENAIDSSQHQQLLVLFNKIATIENIMPASSPQATAVATRDERPRYDEPARATDSGDKSKYHATITETLSFEMEHDGGITGSDVKGVLAIKNDGQKNRIWDIDVELEGGKAGDIEKTLHVPELQPGEAWEKEYKIKLSGKDAPQLKITEEIDTFPDTETKSQVFIYDPESRGQVASVKIVAENTGNVALTSLELVKAIPPDFESVDIISYEAGRAVKDGSNVVWTVENLDAGASIALTLNVKVMPNEKKTFSSGEISAKYFMEGSTFTGLSVGFIDGWSDQIHFVERDERDEEPDTWDCEFSFRNRSEFPMRLDRYQFVFGDENTETLVVEQELDNVIIAPGQEWEAEPWNLKSEDEPTFSEDIEYTVVADVSTRLAMSIAMKAIPLRVLALEGAKTFDKVKVRSYRETALQASISVKTQGKAPIDVIHVEDVIPRSFKNPAKEDMVIMIEEKEIPANDFSFSFEPDTDEMAQDRKMLIEIKDVLDNIGELDDETTISIKYPLVAVNPAKDASFEAPVLFQAFTKPAGSPIECYLQPEPITVVHERRRTQIGKAVVPGATKGDYAITLIYRNKGDARKENVEIADFVPAAFTILEASMDYEAGKEKTGTLLTWTIPTIEANAEYEITYKIHGEGEDYSLKEIEARSFK